MVASVAVMTDEKVFGEYTINYKKTHSKTLLPMINRLVSFLEMDLSSIDAIAVTIGPGSFTGLRIGVATAKGMAQALNKPIIQIPTLHGLAYNLRDCASDKIVCPIMDARRNQVFTAMYRFKETTSLDKNNYKNVEQEVIHEQCAMDIEELIEKLNEYEKEVIFLGDGVKVFDKVIEEKMKVLYTYADVSIREQKASSIGALALEYLKQGKTTDADMVKPEYLRVSQAERQLIEKEKMIENK